MSQEVHAPYHFVPLSKWVYMPDWAYLVSHDHPFEDGHSGVIEYTLTNKTPLCVGDTKDEHGVLKFARDPMGNPVIPGSSLKGMIRNVLEIASFGKFSAVDNQRFSYRDISSRSDYLERVIKPNKVQSGWIKYNKDAQCWEFTECAWAKVSHDEIANSSLKTKIINTSTAVEKYKKLGLDKTMSATISAPRGQQKNQWAESLGEGNQDGHFVFTNDRIKGKGKPSDYEFSYFFYNRQSLVQSSHIQQQVSDLFANHQGMVTGAGIDGNLASYIQKNQHSEFGIPVFALMKQGNVHSFGFAKMPRVTYNNSTVDLIENQSKAHTSDAYFDMAELMFGTLRDNGLGLKSRVTFSDAVIDKSTYQENISIYQAKPTVLASPKATFLGGYLEQDLADKYRSYDDENAKVSGWKRYPARKGYEHHEPSNDNAGAQSKFELLTPDHSFTGRIVFHNLKSEELSALIWCLTLNNSSFNQHSLGHGKPLGAGGVVIKLSDTSRAYNYFGKSLEIKASEYAEQFTKHMNTRYDPQGKWESTPQIKHLLALTDEDIENYNEFSYQELKAFQKIKNDKAALPGLEINGEMLSIQPLDNGLQGSNSFAKGRLSSLFDKEDKFHQEQYELSDIYQTKLEERDKKQQLANEKAALNEMDLPPYEKSEKLLQFIVASQDELTSTERKSKTKELRDILKVIKEVELEAEQVEALLSLYRKITLSDKDTSKAIKYLEKLN